MKMYPSVTLTPGRDIPVKAGHPWIYSQGVAAPALKPGSIVSVVSSKGEVLGIGFYNPLCVIRIRMIHLSDNVVVNEEFFVQRLRELQALKESYLQPQTNGYRWVYAESDGLPGLIIDKFDKTIVFQIHTAGMDALREMIVAAILKVANPSLLIERSDVGIRKEEGLTSFPVTVHHGTPNSLEFFYECGILLGVDPLKGQKTGFFLDQREARNLVHTFSTGKKVLNLFSYTGAFSLSAALGGATRVDSVDISRAALDVAKILFEKNTIPFSDDHHTFLATDAFRHIDNVKKGQYDLIICDPPAFAKSGTQLAQAKEGYIRINKKCAERLEPGQCLLTSSCSGRITQTDFENLVRRAVASAGKQARILHRLGQATCHTERLAFPEGQYLKTLLIKILP
jgi:23S rRNA (cytosine1962-C5)-methyltransferase